MAAASDDIITDSLNLKIVDTIPINKIDKVFVELGFEQITINKERALGQMRSSIDDAVTSLLSSWKTKHGCGLDQAETLKAAMKKHGIDAAVKLIQEAINNVIPPPPTTGLQTDVTDAPSTSTSETSSPMEY